MDNEVVAISALTLIKQNVLWTGYPEQRIPRTKQKKAELFKREFISFWGSCFSNTPSHRCFHLKTLISYLHPQRTIKKHGDSTELEVLQAHLEQKDTSPSEELRNLRKEIKLQKKGMQGMEKQHHNIH